MNRKIKKIYTMKRIIREEEGELTGMNEWMFGYMVLSGGHGIWLYKGGGEFYTLWLNPDIIYAHTIYRYFNA